METLQSKSEKTARLAEAILHVVAQSGLDQLTFSKLARMTGISRAWLYKYGGAKEDLVAFAVSHFARMFNFSEAAGPGSTNAREWLKETTDRFEALLAHAEMRPLVVSVYFRFRGTETVIGKGIKEFEARYSAGEATKIKAFFGLSMEHAMRMIEVIGDIQTGLAHGWVHGNLQRVASRRLIQQDFKTALDSLLPVKG